MNLKISKFYKKGVYHTRRKWIRLKVKNLHMLLNLKKDKNYNQRCFKVTGLPVKALQKLLWGIL